MDRLYLNGVLADLPPSGKIGMTIKNDIFSGFTISYSSRLKLPKTSNNEVIFELASQVSSQGDAVYGLIEARYVAGGVEIIPEGYAVVNEANEEGYEIVIYDSRLDLLTTLKEGDISELGYLVVSGWNASDIDSKRLATSGVAAIVLNWGKSGAIFQLNYFLPCFYYHDLVTSILESTGLTLSGDILSSNDFLELVMPYGRDTWEYPIGQNENYEFAGQFSVSSPITTDGLNDNPLAMTLNSGDAALWVDQGDYLELADTGRGSERWLTMDITAFSGTLAITTWTPGDQVRVILEIYHPTEGYSYTFDHTADEAGSGASPVLANLYLGTGFPSTTTSETQSVVIGDGTRVRYYVKALSTTAGIVIGTASSQANFSAVITTVVDRDAVSWNLLLPSLTQKDVIRDFTARFGIIYKQKNGTLYMKTIQAIIDDGVFVDWTGKRVKNTTSINFASNFAQENKFAYSDNIDDPEMGAWRISIPNTNLDVSKTLFTSPFGNSKTATYSGGKKALIPVYDSTSTDIDEFAETPGLRLLTIRAKEAGEGSITFNAIARSDYKVGYFVDPDQTKDTGFQYFVGQYYDRVETALQKHKIVTRSYYLTEVDIANFDQFKMVFDTDAYYIVQSIKYVNGKASDVVMMRV